LRQIVFEHAINHFDRAAHDWIVWTANAEPHEVKEIAADHLSRGMETVAIGHLDPRCIRIGMRVRRISIGRLMRM